MPRLASRLLPHWVDPAVVFAGGPARASHSFWLDAADGRGWSFLGTGQPASVDLTQLRSDAKAPVPLAGGYDGPFRGGWVGWSGYDGAAARAGAPADLSDPVAPELWLEASAFVAFDHNRREVWLVAADDRLDAFAREVAAWSEAEAGATAGEPAARIATARHTPEAYRAMIAACREAIRAGDAYQLCATTRFCVDARDLDPAAVYLRLRAAQPSTRGLYIRSGADALCGASPEQFLRITAGTVRTRPIKGTRPRGADRQSDAALAAELVASRKERAENVMIVDLMRSDLQRVCAVGSVVTERLLEVENHPAVHQLVSTVAGRLRPEVTLGEVLDATFPAGSMTGAPKLSAMGILHALENGPRGPYSGCAGWIGANGDADLAMVIRTICFGPTGAAVGAGGGITWLSDADEEIAEVAIKARGPLQALGASLPPGWARVLVR